MKELKFDDFTKKSDDLHPIYLESLDGMVYLRPLSAGDMLFIQELPESERKASRMVPPILIRLVCDKEGNSLFASYDNILSLAPAVFTELSTAITDFVSRASDPLDKGKSETEDT